jgi:Peptidase A4 family
VEPRCPWASGRRLRAVVVSVAAAAACLTAYPALTTPGAAASPAQPLSPISSTSAGAAAAAAAAPGPAPAAAAGSHFRQLGLRRLGDPGRAPALAQRSQPLAVEPGAINGASESDNWSGYVDAGPGSKFTGVSGSWTVPSLTGNVVGAASSWIGIGGWSTPGLVQAGVEVRNTLGYDEYFAWYEILPQPAITLGNVAPGDRMQSKIVQDGPSTWTITLTDVTERTTWSGPVATDVYGTSAEWVEEEPASATTGNELGLVDFGTVRFSDLGAQGPGTATAVAQPFYLVSSNSVLAYPSRYDQATNSFTVTYGSPSDGVVGYAPVPIGPTTTSTTTSTSTSTSTTTTGPGGLTTTSAVTAATSTTTSTPAPPTTPPHRPPRAPPDGYWLAGADGGVFAFGGAHFYGSAIARAGGKNQIVGIAATPDHKGYWLVSSDGAVFAFGDARYFGSIPGLRASGALRHALGQSIVGITASNDGRGYYLVTADGGVYTFGDARFEGSCGDVFGACESYAVALVPDGTGRGYWLVLGDASSQNFGNAPALRDVSCLSNALYELTYAMAAVPTPDGRGYWTLLANGTTCAAGDALGRGIWAAYDIARSSPAVAIVTTDRGAGAWLVLANGEVDPYGTALSLGDLGGRALAASIVGAAGW